MKGAIKKLNATFGFISSEDGVDRFFIPQSLAKGEPNFSSLKPGQEVEFTPEHSPKGERAANIRVVAQAQG